MRVASWIFPVFVIAALWSDWSAAQAEATENGAGPQSLADAETRMRDARARLEAAAADVARLSAERVGPIMRKFAVTRDFTVARPLLGLVIDNADGGVRVVGVTPNGAAAEAGIMTDDLLVAIDGESLAGDDQATATQRLMSRLALVDAGDTVTLQLHRGEEALSLEVVTREAGRGNLLFADMPPTGPGHDVRFMRAAPPFDFWVGDAAGRRWRSMELVELTPGLGEYFGTDQGLLVVRAPDDEMLRLLDGDVILSIGGRTPASAEHALRILASFEPGENLQISIMRMRRRQTLEIEVPSTRPSGAVELR